MTINLNRSISPSESQHGITLIEVMIVVAIIGVLAAIAYPTYQRYVLKSKRTDMMSEMQNIATQIQSNKLAQGSYSNDLITGLGGSYPTQGNALYQVTFTPDPLTSNWSIIATPEGQMATDGTLSLDFQGTKCRGSGVDKKCGTGNDWNE
ncbi:type IV pilin protein [Psychrobacter fjordensis]|uniref:type IV pilin protein n=1 Tax=Psychrobacter fjordensis TaxID=664424 RepID=UPI001918A647|nr:type IV pilin protein [Psychrobacter fjordensis]